MAIIKHITYRCDICGKECEDCITPHSIHFNHYLDNTLLRYEYINKFDVCVECNDKILSFVRELIDKSSDNAPSKE